MKKERIPIKVSENTQELYECLKALNDAYRKFTSVISKREPIIDQLEIIGNEFEPALLVVEKIVQKYMIEGIRDNIIEQCTDEI